MTQTQKTAPTFEVLKFQLQMWQLIYSQTFADKFRRSHNPFPQVWSFARTTYRTQENTDINWFIRRDTTLEQPSGRDSYGKVS